MKHEEASRQTRQQLAEALKKRFFTKSDGVKNEARRT